jgi:hypothetical protein
LRDNKKLRELWEQLGWATSALSSYKSAYNDEFLRGIEDPNLGKGMKAPDNYAMVELGLRKMVGSVEDCVAIINDLYEEMGFALPFPRMTRRN